MVAWLLIGVEAAGAQAQGQPIVPSRPVSAWRVPDVTVSGRWLVDRTGRVVVIHGTNMISKYAPYTYQAVHFGARDLRFLRAEGIDAIRLGWIWEALEPTPGHYNIAYLNDILAMVHLAERCGLQVILDFHQDSFNQVWHGEGFPAWTFNANDAKVPYPLGLGLAWQGFMNDRVVDGVGVQEWLVRAWQFVAKRLLADRSVIFEPLNEPYPFAPTDIAEGCLQPLGCPISDRTRLWPLYNKLLQGIRQIDPTRLVFVEPWFSFDYGVRSWLPGFNDRYVGFAPHVYCPTGGAGLAPTIPGSCPPDFQLGFSNIAFHEQQTGEPTLITEFGAGGPEADFNAVESLADQQMIGWYEWAYWSQDNGSPQTYALVENAAQGPVYGNVHLDQLDAITRPYPRLIAGTPTSWSYNVATDGFALRYRPVPVGGGSFPLGTTSQIVLPSLHYPHGYVPEVLGATILSAPNASVLVIAACPGATAVTVEVGLSGTRVETCRPRVVVVSRLRRYRAGRPTRLAVRALVEFGRYRVALPGATVQIHRRHRRTGRRGWATFQLSRRGHARRYRIHVRAPGYPGAGGSVRASL